MKQLDQKWVWYLFVRYALSNLFLVIFICAFIVSIQIERSRDIQAIELNLNWLNLFWLIIPVLLIFQYIWARLEYRFYLYELTVIGFKKESGVIYKKYITIPYERIQNVDIYRGLVARIFGLSDLQIQTAGFSAVIGKYGATGGTGAEGRLPGLSKEAAEKLRDELIQRSRQQKTQGI